MFSAQLFQTSVEGENRAGLGFIKLLSREHCLANFFAKQKNNKWGPAVTCQFHGSLAGYMFLLSKIFLCVASYCAYMLYENSIQLVRSRNS